MTNPEQMREAWNKFAEGYDKAITPFSMQIAEDALGRIDLTPGASFLDVAAGGGALSIPAARLGAQVLATDFSPVMVDRLRANARSIGLANLQVKVMDGQALDLEDDSFDFSGSQLGLMLFPDRERGLAELHRVTRPGGQALVVVFGPVQAVEGFLYFFRAVKSAVPTFTPPANSPIFSLQDPAQVRQEMAAAGFDEVRVETVDHKLEVKSAVRLWDMLTSATPPLGALAASLSAEQRAAAKAALAKLLQERMEGTAALLNMRFHIGIGTV